MAALVARHYRTGEQWTIRTEGDRIASIDVASKSPIASVSPEVDSRRLIVAPALVDLQINGRAGLDFLAESLSIDELTRLVVGWDRDGVGFALPTVTTQSHERLRTALSRLGTALDQVPEVAERVAGIHLEGPYLSPEEGPRGAHPLKHVRPPDWDEFQGLQQASGGRIRLITLAPETAGAASFIRRAVDSGVLVSIGHTATDRHSLLEAIDAGASLSTHLGNGCHGRLDRHPNYLWDQLADDRLTAMVIADGHHLPDEVLRCFVRCKGSERIVAVSDMTGMGGMPPGRYDRTALGAVEVLDDGRLVVAGQRRYLAGAALPLWRAIERLANVTDLTLAEAIDACSTRPGAIVGRNVAPIPDSATCLALLLQVDEAATESRNRQATAGDGTRRFRVRPLALLRGGRMIDLTEVA